MTDWESGNKIYVFFGKPEDHTTPATFHFIVIGVILLSFSNRSSSEVICRLSDAPYISQTTPRYPPSGQKTAQISYHRSLQ